MRYALPIKLSTPPRFLVAGCYGELNTGDEALLHSTLNVLRKRWPDAKISVFSDNPRQTSREFRVAALSGVGLCRLRSLFVLWQRGELAKILSAVRNCDCLIFGGGELVRTDYRLWATLTVWDRALLAQAMGKPVVMLGVGVGALTPGIALGIIRLGASRTIFLARDSSSAESAARIGARYVGVIPDLGFLLPAVQPSIDLPPGPKVGFSLLAPDAISNRGLSHISRADFTMTMAALADEAIRLGAAPVFIPFCCRKADDDRIVHREVVAKMKNPAAAVVIEDILPAAHVKGLIENMDVTVGMRLHACVFGISGLHPTVGLAYDSKVGKVMHSVGLADSVVPVERAADAQDFIRHAIHETESKRAKLRSVLQRAVKTFDDEFAVVFGSES